MRQLERLEAGLMTGNGLDPPLQGISRCRHAALTRSRTCAALQMCYYKTHTYTEAHPFPQSCGQSQAHRPAYTHTHTDAHIITCLLNSYRHARTWPNTRTDMNTLCFLRQGSRIPGSPDT